MTITNLRDESLVALHHAANIGGHEGTILQLSGTVAASIAARSWRKLFVTPANPSQTAEEDSLPTYKQWQQGSSFVQSASIVEKRC